MDPATTRPPLGAGRLVGQTFQLLVSHFTFLFPLAFVPALALAILGFFTAPPAPPPDFDPATELPPMAGPGAVIAFLLSIVLGFVVTGVMSLAALDAVIGKRHTVGEYVRQTLRHLGPIVVLGIALYVFAGIGFALVILPGLYILARFLPWVPAIVFENAGWSGLTRAQELTEGYRWPLAGAIVLFALLAIGLVLLFAPLAALGAVGGAVVLIAIEAAMTAVYYSLVAIFAALVYARLREIREGMSTADIAATID